MQLSQPSILGPIIIAGLLTLLATARILQPDPTGHGTHQQLGLPPCGSITFFGARCPACGMTTSWSYAMRGRWIDAWNSNAGGAILVATALVYLPLFCYFVFRGHWSQHGWLAFSLAICLSASLCVAVVQWVTRLLR